MRSNYRCKSYWPLIIHFLFSCLVYEIMIYMWRHGFQHFGNSSHNTLQHTEMYLLSNSDNYKHITKPSHLSTCLLQTFRLEFRASSLLFQTFVHGFCTAYLPTTLWRILWLIFLFLCKMKRSQKRCVCRSLFKNTYQNWNTMPYQLPTELQCTLLCYCVSSLNLHMQIQNQEAYENEIFSEYAFLS